MAQFLLNGDAIRLRRQQTGLSGRQLGVLVADRLGDRSRGRALSVAIARLERGATGSMYLDADTLAALAAELGLDERDLAEPVLWTFCSPLDGRPIALGLAVALYTSPARAFEGRGFLTGIATVDEARALMHYVDPTPLFAYDRERWLDTNFDRLDDREREFVLTVDPDERALRSLWYAHLVTVHYKASVRQHALNGLAKLADAGTLPAVDFATLADLAQRRLDCDRLRDVPAPLYDRWRAEAEHLAEAAMRTGAMS